LTSNTRTQVEIETLIAEFKRVRELLIAAAVAVPASLRSEPFVGKWDLKDVLAHSVGWDYTNIEALPDFRAGRLPAFFDRFNADWAAINAGLVARFRLDDWEELLASLAESQRAFTDVMSTLGDADLDVVAMWGKRRITLRGMMHAVSKDESEHVVQIRAFIAGRS
jgi:DinB superfamily